MPASNERLRGRSGLAQALLLNVRMSSLEGDWKMARDLVERGLAVSQKEPRHLSNGALLECQVGEFSRGEAYLERLLEAMRFEPPGPNYESSVPAVGIPLMARITGVTDRFDTAQAAAATVLLPTGTG